MVRTNSSFIKPIKINQSPFFCIRPRKSKPLCSPEIFSVFSPDKKKKRLFFFIAGASSPAEPSRRRWRTLVPFLQPVSSPETMAVRSSSFVSPANLHSLAVSVSALKVWKVVSPEKNGFFRLEVATLLPDGLALFVLLTWCVSSCKSF